MTPLQPTLPASRPSPVNSSCALTPDGCALPPTWVTLQRPVSTGGLLAQPAARMSTAIAAAALHAFIESLSRSRRTRRWVCGSAALQAAAYLESCGKCTAARGSSSRRGSVVEGARHKGTREQPLRTVEQSV